MAIPLPSPTGELRVWLTAAVGERVGSRDSLCPPSPGLCVGGGLGWGEGEVLGTAGRRGKGGGVATPRGCAEGKRALGLAWRKRGGGGGGNNLPFGKLWGEQGVLVRVGSGFCRQCGALGCPLGRRGTSIHLRRSGAGRAAVPLRRGGEAAPWAAVVWGASSCPAAIPALHFHPAVCLSLRPPALAQSPAALSHPPLRVQQLRRGKGWGEPWGSGTGGAGRSPAKLLVTE